MPAGQVPAVRVLHFGVSPAPTHHLSRPKLEWVVFWVASCAVCAAFAEAFRVLLSVSLSESISGWRPLLRQASAAGVGRLHLEWIAEWVGLVTRLVMTARALVLQARVGPVVDCVVNGLVLVIIDFHLEHELAILDISIGGKEKGTVRVEGPAIATEPAVEVECVEVISPFEREAVVPLIVVVDFDPIVASVPWHSCIVIHIVTPACKRWSPEIHEEGLSLRYIPH